MAGVYVKSTRRGCLTPDKRQGWLATLASFGK